MVDFAPHKNLFDYTVATPPSPATSGTSLVVEAGKGAQLPVTATDGSFYLTIGPPTGILNKGNAEIVLVTVRSTDTLTITRAQQGTTARSVAAGDRIVMSLTVSDIESLESTVNAATLLLDPPDVAAVYVGNTAIAPDPAFGATGEPWLQMQQGYSATDVNPDAIQFYGTLSDTTTPVKTFWLNGNGEPRSAPSTATRAAEVIYELAEAAGGPSTSAVWKVSTNETTVGSRTSIAEIFGTGHATKPGWFSSTKVLEGLLGVGAGGSYNSLTGVKFRGRRSSAGSPTTGTWLLNDVVIDSNGALWLCTVAGTPGTWKSTSATVTANTVRTVGTDAGADYVCDGTADNVQIQAAFDDAVAAGGGAVFIRAGTYSLSATVTLSTVTQGGVSIYGEGMGLTNIVCAASMTGDTPAFQFGNSTIGSDLTLTTDTVPGTNTITMSSGNAATLAVGDYLLIKSNKVADTESASKYVGEVKQITAIASTTVTLHDVLYDAYTTADSGRVCKINVLKNLTLSDMSITTLAPTSDLSTGFTDFRFIDGLRISRIEQHDAYHSMQIRSCRNFVINDCNIHHIADITPGANLRYGIWVAAASQDGIIANCTFRRTRHSVTFGTNSGTNGNGIQRNVTIVGCVSEESDTGHFDCHQPCDGVQFIGCTAIGGDAYAGASQAVIGYQSRGRNVSFVGCFATHIPGRGFMAFGPAADNTRFIGCTATDIEEKRGGGDGAGFYFDSAGSNKHIIANCMIQNCAGVGIRGEGGNDDVLLIGNVIDNCPNAVSNASIRFSNALRLSMIGNKVINNSLGRPFQMAGTSDNWHVQGNYFYNNATPAPTITGSNNWISDNVGLNPIGYYTNATATGSITVDRVNGDSQSFTLTGNCTPTVTSGVVVGDRLWLTIRQDGTGSRTWTWPSNVKKAGGALVITSTASAVDQVVLSWDGTYWRECSRSLNTS